MIAKLTGTIDSIFDDYLIIDVNGVGYKVFASARTLGGLIIGNPVSLLIETVVREDAFLLFGFKDDQEQYWFNLLTNVQGVGAKVALAIMSSLTPSELTLAIASGDKTSLNRANGVGPKLAMRLITELKDKVKTIAIAPVGASDSKSSIDSAISNIAMEEAVSALVNLGYVRMMAMETVAKILSANPEFSTQDLIKQALKDLSK